MTHHTITATGLVAAALAVGLGTSTAHATPAVARTATTVTIKAQGVDLSGRVKSADQGCITDRLVIVIKQKGKRGGGDDKRFATDTAGADGSWSTGNTGTAGRFYSKVKATADCKRDTSPTIRATR